MSISEEISIKIKGNRLNGNLEVPENAQGLVLFAHGSGSSRFSPRNRYVARTLNEEGLGTLLFDLLTEEEERIDEYNAEYRFNIDLLAARLGEATEWLFKNPPIENLKVGYFGSSTGAAAALKAAAEMPEVIYAVVSRGGRPDLAMDSLSNVKAPTLLIVGGEDLQVIELNEAALSKIVSKKKLEIIAGATHLFEEPGALEKVAALSAAWFTENL